MTDNGNFYCGKKKENNPRIKARLSKKHKIFFTYMVQQPHNNNSNNTPMELTIKYMQSRVDAKEN